MPKKPKFGHAPHSGKAARVDPKLTRQEDERPSWVVAIMDMDGPWSWKSADQATLHEVRAFLASLESMAWNELLHKNRAHSIARWKISRDAQRRLEDIGQDDVDDLVSLRKTGAQRIWGIKDRDVLKLLWWDPDHTVYPVEMRNT